MTLQLIRSRLGQLLGGLAALMLLVGVAGQAKADACTDANPVGTLVTIGKGQSPNNNPKIAHAITGNIVGLAGLGEKTSRVPVCTGTLVGISITSAVAGGGVKDDGQGGLFDPLKPLNVLSCSADGGLTASCSGTIGATQKYIARSADGKDTDRMTLLAK